MHGQLIEYHNPSAGERYGILKEKNSYGKFKITTGWFGYSGGLGNERTSDADVFRILSPNDILKEQKSIENHFGYSWTHHNGGLASTKTLYFADTSGAEPREGKIQHLPKFVADNLVNFFLSEGWFAYAD